MNAPQSDTRFEQVNPTVQEIRSMVARKIIRAVFAAILCGAGVAPLQAQQRVWTDSTGRYSVEAELVEAGPDSVVLKNAKGATVTVPLARLSAADREYLKTREQSGVNPAPVSGPQRPLSFPNALTGPPSWNDVNSPFDLAEFLRAPPPEENAAPLYLEALGEFNSEMLDVILGPYDKLSAADKAEYERRHHVFRDLNKKYDRFEELWQKAPNSLDTAEVDSWLAAYDTGFQKLKVAQQRPHCMFQTGYSIGTLMPHIHVTRQVARVVEWRTRRDLQLGDLERPVDDLKLVLRLTRDLRVRGAFVAQLVADAVDSVCYKEVHAILHAPNMQVEHCDRLLALLIEHEAMKINAFADGNRAEYICCRQALYDLQHRTGDFDPQSMAKDWGLEGDMKSPLACFKIIFFDVGGATSTRQCRR